MEVLIISIQKNSCMFCREINVADSPTKNRLQQPLLTLLEKPPPAANRALKHKPEDILPLTLISWSRLPHQLWNIDPIYDHFSLIVTISHTKHTRGPYKVKDSILTRVNLCTSSNANTHTNKEVLVQSCEPTDKNFIKTL